MAKAQSERTHCPAGHPYDEANTTLSSGRRHCRTCKRERYAARQPPKASFVEIVWSRIRRPRGTSCWVWVGGIDSQGYGKLQLRSVDETLAHRHVYELLVGQIPAGLTLDHLCHNEDASCPGGSACRHRRCVNPSHLEPCSIGVNVMRGQSPPARNARKTHCPQGHEYDEANTWYSERGWRQCRACNRERHRSLGR